MTKDDFIRLAQPQPFTLAGQPLAAQPVFTGQGSCGWLWQGARFTNGYGHLGRGGKSLLTHRLVYEHLVGPIPEGLDVLHICDRKACCRVDHLRLGTQKDNMQDMIAKGRARYSRVPNKLSWPKVVAIRARWRPGTGPALAHEFGVRPQTISSIVHGKIGRSPIDSHERPRRPAGEDHPTAKLTAAQVATIRATHQPGAGPYRPGNTAALAREYGITPGSITDIVRGKTWRHTLPPT